jgi:hypothetical protein
MAFPYSFVKKIVINKQNYNNISTEMIRFALLNTYANDTFLNETNNSLNFKTNHTLVNFSYKISFRIIENKQNITIDIDVQLVELLKITVLLVVFIALFSKFAFSNFLLFSSIFTILFFIANIIFISADINSRIKKSLKLLGYNKETDISDRQKEWLLNPGLCSACGCKLSENDIFCPECGLRIKQNKYTKPLNLSTNKSISNKTIKINYQYKKKNDKTN